VPPPMKIEGISLHVGRTDTVAAAQRRISGGGHKTLAKVGVEREGKGGPLRRRGLGSSPGKVWSKYCIFCAVGKKTCFSPAEEDQCCDPSRIIARERGSKL